MQLFPASHPETSPATPLIGLAKKAAESPSLVRKHQVEYFGLRAQTILNRCASERVPFTWTINPYRGCEFGCKYCYARYTHEYLGLEDSAAFEEKIYSKEHAGEILLRELRKNPQGAIAIGTATDPYQPAERLFRTTRSILETLQAFRGLQLSITTKSDLIRRDLDVLRAIAKVNDLQVNISVTTLCPELARCLEVRAPRPDLRLAAAAELAQAGISVAIFAMPVLPAITDAPRDLEGVARAAARAGACYFAMNALFLMPSAQRAFFPFLEQAFPHLVEKYHRLYARGAYARGTYAKRLQELAERLRAKYHLNGPRRGYSSEGACPDPAEKFAPVAQLRLFETASSQNAAVRMPRIEG
ncbi:MAG: radical SAM protein [Acidobacteria bacterium]|nr:radical SAM protein [Acidobacteriota bacterium]